MGITAFRRLGWVLVVFAACFFGVARADTVQYVYDELGRLAAVIDAGGVVSFYNYDAAGNLLSISRSASTAVAILSFTPIRGVAGTAVTITGTGFVADPAQNTVRFAGTQASVTSATGNVLVAVVPLGASAGPITVSNASGTATSAQVFSIIAPATIAAVTPDFVARGLVTRVEITGSNLAFVNSVDFTDPGIVAGLPAGASDQRLPVVLSISAGIAAGVYPFSVTNAAGTTSSGSVVVTVGASPLGITESVAAPLSIFAAPRDQLAPSGPAQGIARPLSVFAPPPPTAAPLGVTQTVAPPLSVSTP